MADGPHLVLEARLRDDGKDYRCGYLSHQAPVR
jgi:hypothetical protein